MGAAGVRTLRSLGQHLLHPLILRLLVLCAPADFEAQRTNCTRRYKFLTHTLKGTVFIDLRFKKTKLFRLFNFLFLWVCIKDSNYLLFKRGLLLFNRLYLLFLPNVPGATFIQGDTFIPDSRVYEIYKNLWTFMCARITTSYTTLFQLLIITTFKKDIISKRPAITIKKLNILLFLFYEGHFRKKIWTESFSKQSNY